MADLIIAEKDYEKIIEYCKEEYPLEACGIIAGEKKDGSYVVEKIYLMENSSSSSEEYLMDYEEQFEVFKDIRKQEIELLSVFHSHPETPARPSQQDIDMANYEEAVYAIISLAGDDPVMKTYLIQNGKPKLCDWSIKQ